MDPNSNLKDQVELAKAILAAALAAAETADDGEVEDGQSFFENAINLSEMVLALDQWLSNGGFLPTRWTRNRGVK